MLIKRLSDKFQHYFHVMSEVHPLTWILLYILMLPIFATIYWLMPVDQFRYPEDASLHWGAWLYYSIVTLTTLGFGEYTPAHGFAQAITAVEVMCGLIFLGFFLNAVGSLKSELDVESEVEKQRLAHKSLEKQKLMATIPSLIHSLNIFLAYCYAVTTPEERRTTEETKFNPDFRFSDLKSLFKPSDLPIDRTDRPAAERLLKSADHICLVIDTLQSRVDLTLWPEIMECCFGFVANYQMFSINDPLFSFFSNKTVAGSKDNSEKMNKIEAVIAQWKEDMDLKNNPEIKPIWEFYYFIKENSELTLKLENLLTQVANEK